MVETSWESFGEVANGVGEVNRFPVDQQLFKGESHLISPELETTRIAKKENSE